MFDVTETVEEVVHDEAHEQLVFRIGDMLIAIPVLLVREILDRTPYISLPRAPHYVLGMIDVRAESIAVIDFAEKLGHGAMEEHEASRIVILELPATGAESAARSGEPPPPPRVLAILTDGVVAVTELGEADDQQLPEVGEAWSAEFIEGLGRLKDGQIVIRVDLEQIFLPEQHGLFA